VTSVVTLLEILVRPLQLGRRDVARDYETFVYQYPNLAVLEIDRDIARLAADLRARYRVATADGLQLATALKTGAAAFLTNDRRLQRVQDLAVLVVDDFLAG
jgi:predicted nucleic acid-binding protein